ncbi:MULTISPECIES: ribosome hibernation-promoting factor, HPF/YfiA family [Thermodesulfovibrio]|jgi:putative sigma-54 modulation protein|uniref:Ribosome hibernation promoting factor n=2 Tax=Thermodesulfovibrio yellowstonii TaxID=28262 RepID=B5YI17_THEYD|nr:MULTISPECIES: ribosome-associated translation inhibitor RaiA [Thermodesulfovibrio]ACI22015.1 SSU ribosomal protein S30P [Thermodesulfovibrio yellowstonii DSM 11347]MDI6864694.1 ribosome-associated translation inhibitor RaiA [Thermodesulfovibrio yellowstonii]GLI54420.1 ribosomal subunit interface protein [Thermodesulfovibrio islandicus]
MKITIRGKNIDVTEALKQYIEKRVTKFERFLTDTSEAIVTISTEKFTHKIDVLLKVDGHLIQAEGKTEDLYSAVDQVVEKLEKQVLKYKEKVQNKNKKETIKYPSALSEEVETAKRIVKYKKFDLRPMSPEEAVDQLELLDKDFFIFINSFSGDVNVIYKRKDGNFGLIEPAR